MEDTNRNYKYLPHDGNIRNYQMLAEETKIFIYIYIYIWYDWGLDSMEIYVKKLYKSNQCVVKWFSKQKYIFQMKSS